MNNPGRYIKEGYSKTMGGLRTAGNIGLTSGAVLQGGVIGENMGVAPEVSKAVANVAESLPSVLNVSSEIPGVGEAIQNVATYFPGIQDLTHDLHTIANVGAYMSFCAIFYWMGRLGFGKKGKLEAGGNAVVWTTLSVILFKEMAESFANMNHDLMGFLPLMLVEQFPEALRSILSDADSRRISLGLVEGGAGMITTGLVLNNIGHLFGRNNRKNKQEAPVKKGDKST